MPSAAHERIDRIARHLSASSRGTTRSAGSCSAVMPSANDIRPPITSHALDTATGRPAEGLPLKLERQVGGPGGGDWCLMGSTTTNDDGRAPGLIAVGTELLRGTYRVTFDTESYFRLTGAQCFYPEVTVMFRVENTSEHLHIPLLLSPFGYSTYKGS